MLIDHISQNFENCNNGVASKSDTIGTVYGLGISIYDTVKSEITHTLGGHQILWVITGYGFSQVYLHMFHKSWWTQKAMGFHRLWVITVWVISGLTV